MMFTKYVSFETIQKATFNYWEPSFTINKDGKIFTVYHTKYPIEPKPNLFVLEAFENPEELYFRAFTGKHSGECKTEKEVQQFLEKVKNIVNPVFRIKGKNLEKKILKLLSKVDQGKFIN